MHNQISFSWAFFAVFAISLASPKVRTRNGTVEGVFLPELQQNIFLGIPYAEPPVGRLRFEQPHPYNSTWPSSRKAQQYGNACYGVGTFSDGLKLGEDCLTLNVVAPSRPCREVPQDETDSSESGGEQEYAFEPTEKFLDAQNYFTELPQCQGLLPVFVWIYGGGFAAGGSGDPRYNLSYLVNTSMSIGKPMIAVSLNYRHLGFGFASGGDIPPKDWNAGLKDQRLALHWVQENIQAFGGDPKHVIVAGESAGAWSVGYQLIAHGGNSEGLFQGAILQSGTMYGKRINSTRYYTQKYNELVELAGCKESKLLHLDCLRAVPEKHLFNIFVSTLADFFWDPIIDGDFLPDYPYKLMEQGKFARVPLLLGTNMDECTVGTHGPRNGMFNTTEHIKDFLTKWPTTFPGYRVIPPLLSAPNAEAVLRYYPDDASLGCPFKTGQNRFEELGHGLQFKRGAAIIGDWLMQAGRRHVARLYSAQGLPVYSYHFEQEPWTGIAAGVAEEAPVGVPHFAEVAYVFGIPDDKVSNWVGSDRGHLDLQSIMSRQWVSFVTTLDPNNHQIDNISVPEWPLYLPEGGRNMVFRANASTVETDVFRSEGMELWANTWHETTTAKD